MDLQISRREFVYPGHPVVIAYMVTQKYSSLEEALLPGYQSPLALEDSEISGAGGSVYTALGLLKKVQKGLITPEEFIQKADEVWGYCDDHARDPKNYNRWQEGLAQAKKVPPHLLKTGWVEKK